MALYRIEWKQSAKKELRKLPNHVIGKIIVAIDELSRSPIPVRSRKILGRSIHIEFVLAITG